MLEGLIKRGCYALYASRGVQFLLGLYAAFLAGRKWRRPGSRPTAGGSKHELANGGEIGRGRKAAVIWSRTHWNPDHPLHRCGTGRMQAEVFKNLQGLGFSTEFAGEEDRQYSREVLDADLIITVPAALPRIFRRINGVAAVFTCNTHVLVNNRRLIESSRKWGLSCEYFIKAPAQLKGYQQADYLLIAENDQGIGNFLSNGIRAEKIKRYRNCIDHEVWVPNGSRRSRFTFVFWGSFAGLRKGLPALVSAWKRWYAGQDAELHLFGMPTSVSDLVLNGVREGNPAAGLFAHLRTYPAQDPAIIEFLGSSQVGVFPTLEDAQPSTLLEMASCGLPIITTRESGVDFTPDFCRYVSRDSVEGLQEAFQYWYERRGHIEEYGLEARSYVQNNHNWKSFRERFNTIISEIMMN